MESLSVWNYLTAGAIIWLVLVSFYLIKIAGSFKKLTRGSNNLNLEQILDNLAKSVDLSEKKVGQLSQELSKLEVTSRLNIQKHALIRFNPFEDTGGDQSFVAAFLDGDNSGIVISSLHSRTGTRVYAKSVRDGLAASHQFSKEEKEVVEKAAHRDQLPKQN